MDVYCLRCRWPLTCGVRFLLVTCSQTTCWQQRRMNSGWWWHTVKQVSLSSHRNLTHEVSFSLINVSRSPCVVCVRGSGAQMVPISWCEMQCPRTHSKEFRKVARVQPEYLQAWDGFSPAKQSRGSQISLCTRCRHSIVLSWRFWMYFNNLVTSGQTVRTYPELSSDLCWVVLKLKWVLPPAMLWFLKVAFKLPGEKLMGTVYGC